MEKVSRVSTVSEVSKMSKQCEQQSLEFPRPAFTFAEGRPACTTTQVAAKAAFTLAEVLITLAVIGIVAAMTMPALVQKYQEKARVTALKKFYSVINQAVQMAVIEHGTPDMWGVTNPNSTMLDYIKPYLVHAKFCDISNRYSCHTARFTYKRNGEADAPFIPDENRHALQLGDGTMISILPFSDTCEHAISGGKNASSVCGEYLVDINASAAPNTMGKDIFIFNLTKYGVIPVGAPEYDIEPTINENYKFSSGCLDESSEGWGCAGWVIENGNMDYWHCSDLAWDGKHKCSD